MHNNQPVQVDPVKFIDMLIKEMNMQNEDPEKLKALKENMLVSLNHKLSDAISENIDPEAIDQALEEEQKRVNGDEDKVQLGNLMVKMVNLSPSAQEAVGQAMEDFRDRTLHAHKVLVLGQEA